ncbi:MAG: hypothetical protein JRJ23_07410 [Deltaproteobacteria bacterium]|nr:hypothetical protein [Deltaproteobacteria bacterium]
MGKIRELLNEYYDKSGWDKKTGKPGKKILKNLDLEEEKSIHLLRPGTERSRN